jgi:EAL domain-containing protein (putative c-di-GMP-specific phosphodiesterase class I)
VTERVLAADRDGLLDVIDQMRYDGYQIAIDDVGAEPESLHLITELRPDIIKIDKDIVQHPDSDIAQQVVSLVQQQSSTTGATILAEGVETPADLVTAREIAATLSQGFLFGRPGRLPRFCPAVPGDLAEA